MKIYSNEKGATLVTALVIITVMMIIVTALLFQLNSLTKQTEKSEEHIQAESLAEMGVEHFTNHVDTVIEAAKEANEDIDLSFLQSSIDQTQTVQVDQAANFSTTAKEQPTFTINLDPNDIVEIRKNENEIEGYELTFLSNGKSGETTIDLERKIRIFIE